MKASKHLDIVSFIRTEQMTRIAIGHLSAEVTIDPIILSTTDSNFLTFVEMSTSPLALSGLICLMLDCRLSFDLKKKDEAIQRKKRRFKKKSGNNDGSDDGDDNVEKGDEKDKESGRKRGRKRRREYFKRTKGTRCDLVYEWTEDAREVL